MKRGRPITRIGKITRGTFENEHYGKSARTFQNRMAMMRAFDRLTHDGRQDLANWFWENRRQQVLAALGRLPVQYITDVATKCRNLNYDDGPGPVTGGHMLDFIKESRAWIEDQHK